MTKLFATLRVEFDLEALGATNLEVGNDLFGYKHVLPFKLKATKKGGNPITVVDFSPELEDVKANVGNTLWINVKTAEPKIAAKRGKAKAKAEAPMAAAPEVDPALIAAILAALGKK